MNLKKYMSFTISSKLVFIDSFKFLGFSFGSLVNNLSKNDFRYLIQECDSKVLDLIKQKRFILTSK